MLGAAAFAATVGVLVSAGMAIMVLVVKNNFEPRDGDAKFTKTVPRQPVTFPKVPILR